MSIILIRGGGDLATGVALRLFKSGLKVVITELPDPLAVRRLVSFSEAVYKKQFIVERVKAERAEDAVQAKEILAKDNIPVLVDPELESCDHLAPLVLIDARMMKSQVEYRMNKFPFLVGLGPEFIPGENCHAAVETQRGHTLGRVLWDRPPEPDTGVPEGMGSHNMERVIRAPADGRLVVYSRIGDRLVAGQKIAQVAGIPIKAPFSGVLRGLLYADRIVQKGLKIGDLDPRNNPEFCRMVSDKALAIGGGVLEAILSCADLRSVLWV
jgi:xanthine dehydrogenase accessory factor